MHPPTLTETRLNRSSDQEKSLAGGLPSQSEFESVVRRHSAMVLGVCRRMLPNADAEDAAQAVFVLLWRKGIRHLNESRLAGWLHRTAQHVSRNAKRSSFSRFRHEQNAAAESPMMTSETVDSFHWQEIRKILDEEVNRLPDKLRIAFVLFHFEHHSLAEVAELLGSTVPTAGTWLQRSRERLAEGLKRRGVVVGATTIAALLSEQLLAEAVPASFVAATVQTVADVSAVGLTACSPLASALVKAGAVGGLSKTILIASSLMMLAVSVPLVVFWLVPAWQTRNAPDFLQLQGEWRQVSHEQDGGPVNAFPKIEFEETLLITGRSFRRTQKLSDGRVLEGERGTFVLDRSHNSATIDFQMLQGTGHGVYELEGDSLTLCITRSGGPRPDDLTTTQNDNRILSRYKRVK